MNRRGPLVGVRVVELAGLGPAQHGAMLLADLGADVIRVDRGPADADRVADARREVLSRGRRSIVVDLKATEGIETAWSLLEWADVLIDPYRPGVLEKLGLGPEPALTRNPRLIYARMTGWGQDGPLAHAAGHDINYISVGGALGQIGRPGEPPPVPLNLVGDFGGGGMLLAFGVTAALLERQRSGRGQVIDAAMVDGTASLLGSVFQLHAMGTWRDGRESNWLQGAAPWYRAYETADGRYVTVGPLEDKFYRQLLAALGLDPAQWPQWDESRWPALAERLTTIFAERSRAEWEGLLAGTDVCFAPVLELGELLHHPHLAARGTYVEELGVLQPAPVPRFSRTPGAISGPPPAAGEHTDEIRDELTTDD